MIEPIATTVATLEPEIAANIAQAATPASPSPPGKWPTSEVVKAIMRRATPPRVRKVPARMKNGIAMIPKLSRPENSFRPTLSIGTSRHREQEGQHGEAERNRDRHARQHQRKQQSENEEQRSSRFSQRDRRLCTDFDAVDMGRVVMRQLAGPEVGPATPAGSGSTSDRSRAECRHRRSSSAVRGRARPGRCSSIR